MSQDSNNVKKYLTINYKKLALQVIIRKGFDRSNLQRWP